MGAEKDPFDWFDQVRRIDLGQRSGLVAATIANVVGVSILATCLHALGVNLLPQYYLIVIVCAEISLVGVSYYQRSIRVEDKHGMALGFAIRTDAKSEEFYKEIRSSIARHIDDEGLNDLVRIRTLPKDKLFRSSADAERYIIDKGIRVLVWGDTTRGSANGHDLSVFNVKFSVQHAVEQSEQHAIKADLQAGVGRAIWGIDDTNSLPGMAVVGGNIIEISLYMLGMCLISVRDADYVERGVTLLENVKDRLERRTYDPNFPSLDQAKAVTKKVLLDQYQTLVTYYLIDKHNPQVAHSWALKAVNLAGDNFSSNIQAARTSWEVGDHAAAKRFTLAARRIKPNDLLPKLNLAFFELCEGKYSKALQRYRQFKQKQVRTNLLETIDFLMKEYESNSEPACMFAAGWLSFHYADKVIAKELLTRFVAETRGKSAYKPLLREARVIMAN